MNEYEYIYTKTQKEFGKHCDFADSETKLLGSTDSNAAIKEKYVPKNPATLVFDNIPEMSEHAVNTERVRTHNRGQTHGEGGWPKEVDASEPQDTSKWRKRLDKDPQFVSAVGSLCTEVQQYIDQNNTIDMFEEYFTNEAVEQQVHSLHASTVAVFKDPSGENERRTVSKISWHPEGPHRFVASYSVMKFQRMDDNFPKSSFIWEVENPNAPVGELQSSSPLISTQYYGKNPDIIAGGAYNGTVVYFDVRQGSKPVAQSGFENSHFDPVYEFVWLQSKTHSECTTVSTDGRVLWWDIRNLQAPTDACQLTDGKDGSRTLGGCCLEWTQEAGPTKYLVGTEEGVALALNKKPKRPVEIGSWFGAEDHGGHGRHHGPINSIRRNPAHVKYFMTVGDWSVKIWLEELKAPLLQTSYAASLLTTGGWSPTRPGVFYTCRQDGFIDFYDYYYRMNEVAYSHKVTDSVLHSASVQAGGRLVACGDTDGTVTLLQLCEELAQPAQNEKATIGAMFERETRREKNLETIKKQQVLVNAKTSQSNVQSPADQNNNATADGANRKNRIDEDKYLERETSWFQEVGITPSANDFTIRVGGQ